jgi:hypothetical protein
MASVAGVKYQACKARPTGTSGSRNATCRGVRCVIEFYMVYDWVCPYCQRAAAITQEREATGFEHFKRKSAEGNLGMTWKFVVCPSPNCSRASFTVELVDTRYSNGLCQMAPSRVLQAWRLRPDSAAKPMPSYVPSPIVEDYTEACRIVKLSPKASATLSRRCLQGMIRDFHGVIKNRLKDEIDSIEQKVDPQTWKAIDAVREVGNIGAHMEKDINLIVDVDEGEAEMLVGLIEILIQDWYVARETRRQHLASVTALGTAKKTAKSAVPPTP